MPWHQPSSLSSLKEVYMAEKAKVGCARPTGGPVGEKTSEETAKETPKVEKEVKTMTQVGKKAPDFIAPAYQKGEFINVQLSEYLGKWVLLCFYPGDFTFV
jgi:hypothetical protein